MVRILKLHMLNQDNTIKYICAFTGNRFSYDDDTPIDLQDLIVSDPLNKVFTDVFTEGELKEIRENGTPVIFSRWELHPDDSISTAKYKICDTLKFQVSPEELYLFGLTEEKLNPVAVYQLLTQGGRLELTRDRLIQFLSNINSIPLDGLPVKELYDYNDILGLDLSSEPVLVKEPIGQKFYVAEGRYLYTVNPFDLLVFDRFLEDYADNTLTTLNNDLVLNSFPLLDGILFSALASDAFSYADENGHSTETFARIYYPFLNQKEITSLQSLDEARDPLTREARRRYESVLEKNFAGVSLFYDIQTGRKTELPYLAKGIRSIRIVLSPPFAFNFPLESVFKLVHVSKDLPLIKFNPGNRQEKIYKLYSDSIAKNGRKIPYLPKGTIFKLVKKMAGQKRVSCYALHPSQEENIPVIFEFSRTGTVEIALESQAPLSKEDLTKIISQSVNPTLDTVSEFLGQSGYRLDRFGSLYDQAVEVVQMEYFCSMSITKNVAIRPLIGCVSNVFNVLSDDLKSGIIMRYKRVANYNEMDSINAFITEKMKSGLHNTDIIEDLVDNFKLSVDAAEQRVADLLSEYQLERSLNENKRLRIRDNPGFLTRISQAQFRSVANVVIDNIDDMYYLDCIPIYIDSILRMTQAPGSTRVPQELITSVCSAPASVVPRAPDIVAPAERGSTPEFPAQALEFDDDTPGGDDDFLDILAGDDDEEESGQAGGVVTGESQSYSTEESSESPADVPAFAEPAGVPTFAEAPRSGSSESSSADVPLDLAGVEEPEDSIGDLIFGSESGDEESLPGGLDLPASEPSDAAPGTTVAVRDALPGEELAEEAAAESIAVSEEADADILEAAEERQEADADIISAEEESQEADVESLEAAEEAEAESAAAAQTMAGADESLQASDDDLAAAEERQETDGEKPQEVEAADQVSTEETPEERSEERSETEETRRDEEEVISEDASSGADTEDPGQREQQEEEQREQEQQVKEPPVQDPTLGAPAAHQLETPTPAAPDTTPEEPDPGIARAIEGMSLTNPNPIFTRLHDSDPALFLTEDRGKFSQYSRACPWNVRRQPIILTDAEKKKIDRESPGSYDKAIKYGSQPGKEHWYICPRYWCLLNNTALSEEDVRQGKCGGQIIPRNAKTVPKGKYILEFNHPSEHQTADGEYIQHNPGFLKNKTENGQCIPCCFKNWNSPEQARRRDQCSRDAEEDPKAHPSAAEKEHYIKQAEKVPLDPGRWGFLPIAVQKFLHTDNLKCQTSHTNHNIKPFTTCLLRYGVEFSATQSFVAAIAAAHPGQTASPPSIKAMKRVIADSLDIDRFVAAQNGSLAVEFRSDDEAAIWETDTKVARDSAVLEELGDKNDGFLVKQIVNAYNNFLAFLDDDEVTIDYTYLWDIVCTPNPSLFPKGINLVVLSLPNADITDDVQLICPTNHYATEFYHKSRSTLFLLQSDKHFEPIFAYRDEERTLSVTKTFSEFNSHLMPNIKQVLGIVSRLYKRNCSPLPSMPRVFKFLKNHSLEKVLSILHRTDYLVTGQVTNFQGQTIGLSVEGSSGSGFLPCYPSPPSDKFERRMMDDVEWSDYVATRDFLNELKKDSKDALLCRPVVKVVEDGMIVGMITETNQFVAIDPPSERIHDDGLAEVSGSDHLVADRVAATGQGEDKERKRTIRNIKLESNFYNVFRNSVRILLNEGGHSEKRADIEGVVRDAKLDYTSKLESTDRLLRTLTVGRVEFIDYEADLLDKIGTVSGCLGEHQDCETKPYCAASGGQQCKLLIPKKNMLSGLDNRKVYYGRMADELIRYSRIRSFIFEPKEYLNFSDVDYNLLPTEIILLQSLLTQEYFENLVPVQRNPYVFNDAYETVEPLITQQYSSTASMEDTDKATSLEECVPKRKRTISGKWDTKLPSKAFEFIFDPTPACSFSLMSKIIANFTDKPTLEPYLLRRILVELYAGYLGRYKERISSVLTTEGKKNMMHQVHWNQITFEDLVMSESYYLTNLDMWVLAEHFDIPLIFLSGTSLVENGDNILITRKSATDSYYIIKSPGVKPDEPSKYRLIGLGDTTYIPMAELPKAMREIVSAVVAGRSEDHVPMQSLDDFLSGFPIIERERKPVKKMRDFVLKEADEPAPTPLREAAVATEEPVSLSAKKVGTTRLRRKALVLPVEQVPSTESPEDQQPEPSQMSQVLKKTNRGPPKPLRLPDSAQQPTLLPDESRQVPAPERKKTNRGPPKPLRLPDSAQDPEPSVGPGLPTAQEQRTKRGPPKPLRLPDEPQPSQKSQGPKKTDRGPPKPLMLGNLPMTAALDVPDVVVDEEPVELVPSAALSRQIPIPSARAKRSKKDAIPLNVIEPRDRQIDFIPRPKMQLTDRPVSL
jgi:hypothetical protein